MHDYPIHAKLATRVNDPPAARVPGPLMILPAGEHTINASKGGQPFSTTVNVTPDTAAVLQADLQRQIRERAPQRPFIDRDHDEKEAMGWPIRIFWQDRPNPGVYAEVEWSESGKDLILGKSYRAFSPSFFLDPNDSSRIVGLDFVAGALTNKPAFRKIAPIWTSHFDCPRINSRLTLPPAQGYVGNPFTVLKIAGDSVELLSRFGERVFVTPTRLVELVALKD